MLVLKEVCAQERSSATSNYTALLFHDLHRAEKIVIKGR
jgi:hypothetical protein